MFSLIYIYNTHVDLTYLHLHCTIALIHNLFDIYKIHTFGAIGI